LIGAVREFCCSWKNQTEVTVPGVLFIQEDSGPAIAAQLRIGSGPTRYEPPENGEVAVSMRKSKQDAAETRRRIIIAAAAEFRRNGIIDTSNSDLMAAAGLTHGGFYRHFESKDQLVAEACDAAVRSMVDTFAAAAAGKSPRSRLKAAAAAYLSTKHRDNPAHGCPLAALGSEIARCGEGVRSAATDGFLRLVEIIAAQYDGARPDLAKQRALAAASLMIGALTMSRIVTDPELSSEILWQANRSFTDKTS
jgi:TetR/AcrR family transcriptional regulator, transcriptional repressor for nem operon